MTRRPAEVHVSMDELRLLARLEGRPLPRGDDLAQVLGLKPAAAWKFVRRMRRAGVLRLVSPVRLRPDTCECITDVQVDATRPADLDALESRFSADLTVMCAARVTGVYDYRLISRHHDYKSANAWSRELEMQPGVMRLRTRMCETVRESWRLAAAILGSD
jgi:DNA-binding Lrp family transcriptional regulator